MFSTTQGCFSAIERRTTMPWVIGHADAFAFEILRPLDTGRRAYPGPGMEEMPRGEDRQADPVAVAAGNSHQQRRQGHLGHVELGEAELPPEDLGRVHAGRGEL